MHPPLAGQPAPAQHAAAGASIVLGPHDAAFPPASPLVPVHVHDSLVPSSSQSTAREPAPPSPRPAAPPHAAAHAVFTQPTSAPYGSVDADARATSAQSPVEEHFSTAGSSYPTHVVSSQHAFTFDWHAAAMHLPHAVVSSPPKRHVAPRSDGGHAVANASAPAPKTAYVLRRARTRGRYQSARRQEARSSRSAIAQSSSARP